jgi:transposase
MPGDEQALSRTPPVLPMRVGQLELRTQRLQRHGVTSLFVALDIATGSVLGQCYRRHRSVEFLAFLKKIDAAVPVDLDIHLVLDNYGTHKSALVRGWLQKRPRYHLHFIPTDASWLNQLERWFVLLTQRQIKRGSHTSVQEVEAAIWEFITIHNQQPKPFRWTKLADQIVASIALRHFHPRRSRTSYLCKKSITQVTGSQTRRGGGDINLTGRISVNRRHFIQRAIMLGTAFIAPQLASAPGRPENANHWSFFTSRRIFGSYARDAK